MQVKIESEVAQSCPTLSDPMDCSLPGSSVHGILQARVLEWDEILRIRITWASYIVSSKLGIKIWSFATAGKGQLYPQCLSSNSLISIKFNKNDVKVHTAVAAANTFCFHAKLSYKLWSAPILPSLAPHFLPPVFWGS